MFKKNTSSNQFTLTFVMSLLFLIILLNSFIKIVGGQETPRFSEPFQKCRTYGTGNGHSKIIASDNAGNIIITNDNLSLTSINLDSNLENWKSQTVGRLEPITNLDETGLYFISSFENENKEKKLVLSLISLKTGITNWQKQFFDYAKLQLTQIQDNSLVYLIGDNKILLAIEKNTGNIRWSKTFNNQILGQSTTPIEQINILLENRLFSISAKSGEVINEAKLLKSSASNSLVKDRYVLLGYATGEFIKVSADKNKNEVLWKIKTGGSISDLIELKKDVLVTSLDNFLYLFSAENGKLKWKRRVGGRINIKPLIYEKYAVVINSADNSAQVIELEEGKIINQIRIENDNYFSGQPFISGRYFIFQTLKGIYLFANSTLSCN